MFYSSLDQVTRADQFWDKRIIHLAGRNNPAMHNVFIAGAMGYIGSRLAEELLRRGHGVFGLVRPGSEKRLPNGCHPIPGNALDCSSFSDKIVGTDAYVQLVGVAHPGPLKTE
jgi:nucleoside-diphosphate-sugar epimerase